MSGIKNPSFQTADANDAGLSADWEFSDNCDAMLTAPACSTEPFPHPDGVDSGRVSGGFDLGMNDLSQQSFTQASGDHNRTEQQRVVVAAASPVVVAQPRLRHSALGSDDRWTAQLYYIVGGVETVVQTTPITVGMDEIVDVSIDLRQHVGKLVTVGWRLTSTLFDPWSEAAVYETEFNAIDDGLNPAISANDAGFVSNSATPDATAGGVNYIYFSLRHDTNYFAWDAGHPGVFGFVKAITGTNPLAGHGDFFLAASGGNSGADFGVSFRANVLAGKLVNLSDTRAYRFTAWMRTFVNAPGDQCSIRLLAKQQAQNSIFGLGLQWGNYEYGVADASTHGLWLMRKGTDLTLIEASGPDNNWHRFRLTVEPTPGVEDAITIEEEIAGVWTTKYSGTMPVTHPSFLSWGAGRYCGFGYNKTNAAVNNPAGIDGLIVEVLG